MVSIIMPVFNGSKFISKAISSVLAQTYQDFELICVDDGSTDNSRQIVESFFDKRIIYIYQEHFGNPARGKNVGIKISKGEYIAFIDQDDIYITESIAKRIEFFENNPAMTFVYSDSLLIDEEGRILADSFLAYNKNKPYSGYCFKELFLSDFIRPQTVMVKKIVFDKVGLFDEQIDGTDDYDMFLRISYYFELGYLNTVLAKWRIHSSSLSKRYLLMAKNDFKTLNKIINLFQDCSKIVGVRDLKKRMYSASFDVSYLLFRSGEISLAREWLLTTFKYKIDIKNFLKLILTLSPFFYNRLLKILKISNTSSYF